MLEEHLCFSMAISVKAQWAVQTCPCWKMCGSSKMKIKTHTTCNWNEVRSWLWGHQGIFRNTTKGVWKELRRAMLASNICQRYKIFTVPWVLCEWVCVSAEEKVCKTEGTPYHLYLLKTNTKNIPPANSGVCFSVIRNTEFGTAHVGLLSKRKRFLDPIWALLPQFQWGKSSFHKP